MGRAFFIGLLFGGLLAFADPPFVTASHPRYVNLGDSIGVVPTNGSDWVNELRNKLDGGGFRLANVAKSGATTQDLLNAQWLDGGAKTTDVGGMFILEFRNDMATGVSLAANEANLTTMWQGGLAQRSSVVLLRMIPYGSCSCWSAGEQTKADQYWTDAQAWCAANSGLKCLDVNSSLWDPANHANLNPAYDSGDGIHFNQAGATAMAGAVKTGMGW